MTATNHALTGAIIAQAVKQPYLALPLAFVSHFLLDALPHFGFAQDIWTRNQQRSFHVVLLIDMYLLAVLFYLAAFSLQSPILVLGMLAAISPDFVWGYRFYQEIRHSRRAPKSRFSRFHKQIQRYERPWGIFVDLIWFAAAGFTLIQLLYS